MSEAAKIVRTRVPVRRWQRYAGADVSALKREPDLLVSAFHLPAPICLPKPWRRQGLRQAGGLTSEEIKLVEGAVK